MSSDHILPNSVRTSVIKPNFLPHRLTCSWHSTEASLSVMRDIVMRTRQMVILAGPLKAPLGIGSGLGLCLGLRWRSWLLNADPIACNASVLGRYWRSTSHSDCLSQPSVEGRGRRMSTCLACRVSGCWGVKICRRGACSWKVDSLPERLHGASGLPRQEGVKAEASTHGVVLLTYQGYSKL